MAGTIPLSMTQQMDKYGEPLAGGKLYFLTAGTVSTPQNAFQDIALTLPWPNPITLDAAGRIPQLFIADGLIKIRLTDKDGVVQLAADNIQVIGASSGSGGGGSVDATTIAQTGDLKPRYGVGTLTGWVRCNGRTIGSAISGGTELADASALALFQYLWATDPNLVVVGGRGATSLADWNANKQMTLPDAKGTVLAGLDGMGGAAAGRLTAAYFGANGDLLGARGGLENNLLDVTKMPAHSHPVIDPKHSHTPFIGGNFLIVGSTDGGNFAAGPKGIGSGSSAEKTNISIDNTGGGQAHANVQPTMVVTIYIKL